MYEIGAREDELFAGGWCDACLDCSVVAAAKGAGNISWSVPKTAEGPLLTFLLCKPISCVGPDFSSL